MSETKPETSGKFTNEDGAPTNVCKVQFDGHDEPEKVALNRATINALVDALGTDSKDWQGPPLSVEIDKLPGKKYPLYLIPAGDKREEDENGYSIIVPKGADDERVPL